MGKRYHIILVVIIVIGFFILDFFNFGRNLKVFFYNKSVPFLSYFYQFGYKISANLEPVLKFYNISKEKTRIEEENKRLISEIVDLKLEMKDLEAIAQSKISGLSDKFHLMSGHVIGFDSVIDPSLIIIDKGRFDGIKVGLPVVDKNRFLVGKVAAVYDNASTIDLVYNFTQPVAVKMIDSGALALIEKGDSNSFVIDLIDKTALIKENELVITSGGSYYSGLILGKVSKIVSGEVFNRAYGEFSFNFKNLDLIFVIEQ